MSNKKKWKRNESECIDDRNFKKCIHEQLKMSESSSPNINGKEQKSKAKKVGSKLRVPNK